MITKWIFPVLALACVSLLACALPTLAPSGGDMVEREFEFSDFDRVEFTHGAQFEVVQSDTFRVRVEVRERYADDLRVVQDGDTLEIGMEPGTYFNAGLRARVEMPALRGVRAFGGGDGEVRGFDSDEPLAIDLSGGSELEGDLRAGEVDVSVSGGGEVELEGSADVLNLELSGGSQARLYDFEAGAAAARLSGGSRGEVDVAGRLDADLSGGSTLTYEGDPELGSVDESGGSRLRER